MRIKEHADRAHTGSEAKPRIQDGVRVLASAPNNEEEEAQEGDCCGVGGEKQFSSVRDDCLLVRRQGIYEKEKLFFLLWIPR